MKYCAYENTTVYVKGFSLTLHQNASLGFVAVSWLDATWVATAVCLVERRGVRQRADIVKMEK